MVLSSLEVGSHRHCSESEDDCRNKDGGDKAKKVKKLIPIKLSRSPSLNRSSTKEKSQFSFHMLSSSSSSSSDVSTPDSLYDSSPNYMKTTTSSEARSDCFLKSPAIRPSSKPKTLTRMSSRLKKASMRKSYGGAETKRKVKQFREMTGNSDERKLQSPVNSQNSKSGNRSSGERIRDVSVYSKPKSISSGQRSGIILTRKPSLKPVRKLAKTATFKSKKIPMDVSQFPESCVEKATCSSALKGSKFPDRIELQPGEERESEKLAVMKVCPYSYCSLHGHSHANIPSLKRFKSIRNRSLKAQKNKRSENQPHFRAKQSGNRNKGNQVSKVAIREVPVARKLSSAVEKSGERSLVDVNSDEASITKGKNDSLASSTIGYEHNMECQNETREEIDLEEEYGSLSRTDSNSSISLNITANVQEINPKYIRMWQLVYKNVVNINSGNAENEISLHGVQKEASMRVENKLLGETNSSSFKVLSDVDQEGTDVNPDAAYRKLELCKNEAIKLVQEAFDRILLPEIQDQSPRNQNPEEKPSERTQAEPGESSISVSSSGTFSVGEDLVPDSEETKTKAENIASVEEKKTLPMVGSRSNQQGPKRWNNLKKLILFKRFVKALEKVRKIDPQKREYLPAKPDPEGEKVYLRRQTTEERKNGEEWMLDYALQQVISKLEPAQKKRVSLLIEAFETVLPVPGIEAHIRPKAPVSADDLQAHGGFSETDKESECQSGPTILFEKLSNLKNVVKGSARHADNSIKVEHQSLMTFSDKLKANLEHLLEKSEHEGLGHETTDGERRARETVACNLDMVEKETTITHCHSESVDMCSPKVKDATSNSETSQKLDGAEKTGYKEVSMNGKSFKIPERVISRLSAELSNREPELDQTIVENDCLISATSGEFDTSTSKDHEESTKVKTAQLDISSIEKEFIPPGEIKTISNINEANEKELEEKTNASMWFRIYKHMVSSIDAKDGYEPLVDETNEKEKDLSLRRKNMGMEDSISNDPNVELQCIEAVKLVNDAIDEIPLPENSNSTHDQLLSVNLIADQGLEKEKRDECSEFLSATTVSDPDEASLKTVNLNSQEGEKELNLGSKPNRQVQKNWSNLKKVILLKRFLKALEKVKKFNPRQPKFLPLVQDAESEKVQLRHQDIQDRKNADEWMLDYALRQAVAELTPARKRKVELLVQAFETVNPTIRS